MSSRPKSALGRLLEAEAARQPLLRKGGISAWVALQREDAERCDAQGGLAGAVRFSPHIMFKIPLAATQREIRGAVKDLLAWLSGLRGEFSEAGLRAAWAVFENERAALAKAADPRKRRRMLDALVGRVTDIAYGRPGKTVGELRGESRAPYGARSPAAALRRKRDRWIKHRDGKLKRGGLAEYDRYASIREELLAIRNGKKRPFGRWSWRKQDPYVLTEDTIRKIATHGR